MPISSGRLPTSARSWRPNGSSANASPDCPPSFASCRASCEARRVEWAKSSIQMKKFTASLASDFAHTVIEPRGHDASCGSLHVACTARPCPRCAMPTLYQPSQRVTDDRPIAVSDGHDFPGLIDEGVPGVAAVIDDVVEGFE